MLCREGTVGRVPPVGVVQKYWTEAANCFSLAEGQGKARQGMLPTGFSHMNGLRCADYFRVHRGGLPTLFVVFSHAEQLKAVEAHATIPMASLRTR